MVKPKRTPYYFVNMLVRRIDALQSRPKKNFTNRILYMSMPFTNANCLTRQYSNLVVYYNNKAQLITNKDKKLYLELVICIFFVVTKIKETINKWTPIYFKQSAWKKIIKAHIWYFCRQYCSVDKLFDNKIFNVFICRQYILT